MLFKRHLLDKILSGEKTQTRRSTERKKGARVYEVGERVGVRAGYTPFADYVIIKRRRKQAIGNISEEDARKEGFANVEEFKRRLGLNSTASGTLIRRHGWRFQTQHIGKSRWLG